MPIKLTRRHGSPYWYMRGSVRGRRVDESTGCSDQEAAEDVLIKRSAEILERTIVGDTLSRTFAEAALSYMDGGGERVHLAPLIKHFGKTKLVHIGQHEIDEAAKTLKPGAAPATLNRHIFTPAVAVLHHAARKKWCPKPTVARPKQPKGRVRWITHEEAERLIAAAAPPREALVVFLLSTGARLSEALYLDWREVDLTAAHVVFLDTKNGENRGVPLHPRLVSELANLPWDRKGAVFRRPAGKIKKAGRVWLAYGDREGEGGRPGENRMVGHVSPRRDRGFHAARLSSHLGDLALQGQQGPDGPDGARRLEVGRDGGPLCARELRPVGALDRERLGTNVGSPQSEGV